ncbi:MAG: DUF503 family protein [Bacillota bacterium]|nr:DUF503 family protein [Bacillota bacterium]
MRVLILEVTLDLEGAPTLKDKRQLRLRLCERLRRRYGLSIAEVDCQDVSQVLCLGIAHVCLGEQVARDLEAKITDAVLSLAAGLATLREVVAEVV